MDLNQYFRLMMDRGASDLLFSVGAPPAIKIEGETQLLDAPRLDSATIVAIADALLSDAQRSAFAQKHEMNLTVALEGVGRFRVNLYRQRGETSIAVRAIPAHIPALDTLNLPVALKGLVTLPRGLVLVAGAAGSGKSTTLAALIDARNRQRAGHIVSIEDPIEFLHTHAKSIVDQREVGVDTDSFAAALKNVIRESVDVIVIGEIRDRETMEQALIYAETGQLCLATLHVNNASQAIDRVLNFFPESERKRVLQMLSLNLKAVICQRLLRNADGGRRIPAVELLLQTTYVSELILKGDIGQLKEAMKQGIDGGMLTFEESLLRLYQSGKISLDEALENADSRSDLALRIRLAVPLTLDEQDESSMAVESVPKTEGEILTENSWADDKARTHRF